MLILNAVGDIMLGANVAEKISGIGADYIFDYIRHELSSADLNIGNLECPLSERGMPREGDFCYRSSPVCARALKDAGFNIISLANNHILDYGPVALSDTCEALEREGILHAGAGINLEKAKKRLVIEKKGIKVAFLSFANDPSARNRRAGCNPARPDNIKREIRLARKEADLIVVSIHHGIEYVDYPNRYIISLFRGAAEEGAALVIGHHPHVVQGIERYKGSLIAYSLGNFVSGYIDEDTRREHYAKTAVTYFTDSPLDINDLRTTEAIILQCSLGRKGVEGYKVIPVESTEDFRPVLMRDKKREDLIERIDIISDVFSNRESYRLDEMDALWQRCKEHNLREMRFDAVLRDIYRFRPRHLKTILPFLKARARLKR